MGKFSFGHGSSRRDRSGSVSSFSSFSSSDSDGDSDFDTRSRGTSRRSRQNHHGGSGFDPRDPLANFSKEFRRTVEEIESQYGSDPMRFRTTERRPLGFSNIPELSDRGRTTSSSYDSGRDRPSAYSGFPGMPGDDRTTMPGFPGMPGDDRTQSSNFQGRGHRFTERSELFNMRRTDSNFSSSDHGQSRRRSPSPSFPTSSRGRGFHRTESPESYSRSYGGSTFRSNSTARPTYRASSPPRRHRSPSPIRRSNTTGGRTDSARGFRTTERTPPGASSKTGGSSSKQRSHSRAESKASSSSRHQYNGHGQYNGHSQYNGNSGFAGKGDYNGGYNNGSRSQSTSPNDARGNYNGYNKTEHGNYNGYNRTEHGNYNGYKKTEHPRTEAHGKSSSNTRSGASTFKPFAATSKPNRSRAELKKIFDAYNTKWEVLSRNDKAYPLPAGKSDLYKVDFAGGYAAKTGNWTNEEILIANVQLVFLAGFGMSGSLKKASDHLSVRIDAKELNGENLKLLTKWLSRKEQPRWHPDRMNLRTGVDGRIDEGISKRADVVAMRTAAQSLLEIAGK